MPGPVGQPISIPTDQSFFTLPYEQMAQGLMAKQGQYDSSMNSLDTLGATIHNIPARPVDQPVADQIYSDFQGESKKLMQQYPDPTDPGFNQGLRDLTLKYATDPRVKTLGTLKAGYDEQQKMHNEMVVAGKDPLNFNSDLNTKPAFNDDGSKNNINPQPGVEARRDYLSKMDEFYKAMKADKNFSGIKQSDIDGLAIYGSTEGISDTKTRAVANREIDNYLNTSEGTQDFRKRTQIEGETPEKAKADILKGMLDRGGDYVYNQQDTNIATIPQDKDGKAKKQEDEYPPMSVASHFGAPGPGVGIRSPQDLDNAVKGHQLSLAQTSDQAKNDLATTAGLGYKDENGKTVPLMKVVTNPKTNTPELVPDDDAINLHTAGMGSANEREAFLNSFNDARLKNASAIYTYNAKLQGIQGKLNGLYEIKKNAEEDAGIKPADQMKASSLTAEADRVGNEKFVSTLMSNQGSLAKLGIITSSPNQGSNTSSIDLSRVSTLKLPDGTTIPAKASIGDDNDTQLDPDKVAAVAKYVKSLPAPLLGKALNENTLSTAQQEYDKAAYAKLDENKDPRYKRLFQNYETFGKDIVDQTGEENLLGTDKDSKIVKADLESTLTRQLDSGSGDFSWDMTGKPLTPQEEAKIKAIVASKTEDKDLEGRSLGVIGAMYEPGSGMTVQYNVPGMGVIRAKGINNLESRYFPSADIQKLSIMKNLDDQLANSYGTKASMSVAGESPLDIHQVQIHERAGMPIGSFYTTDDQGNERQFKTHEEVTRFLLGRSAMYQLAPAVDKYNNATPEEKKEMVRQGLKPDGLMQAYQQAQATSGMRVDPSIIAQQKQ